MSSQKSTAFHLFLMLALVQLLIYFFFIGQSVVDIHQPDASLLSGELFNYFVGVSLCIVLIWISYWVTRKKLISSKLIWLHLLVTLLAVCLIPLIMNQSFVGMPARYYSSGGFQISDIFGSMTFRFKGVVLILLLSEFFLLKNIQQQSKS